MIWLYLTPVIWVIIGSIIYAIMDWKEGKDLRLGDVLWALFIAIIPGVNFIFSVLLTVTIIDRSEKIVLIKGRKAAK